MEDFEAFLQELGQPINTAQEKIDTNNDSDELKNIVITDEFKKCLDIMENTNDHMFITGDAGTGKSTLIKYFIKNTKKNVIIVAPTGIAAVNIGGVTIHNFFKFPAKPITSREIKILKPEEIPPYKCIDTIIIDEISMVRSDLMEGLNMFLQLNLFSDAPFADKQIIMVGDPMQLPPVVPSDAEVRFLKNEFGGEFFFDATVWNQTEYHKIRLTHNFRQKNGEFLNLLNKIKIGTVTMTDLALLNTRCIDCDESGEIPTLCTTNALSDNYNQTNLDRLETKSITIPAKISGKFNPKYTTFEERLVLKPDALIMMIANDPLGRWFNGTMARFIEYDKMDDKIKIMIGSEIHWVNRSKMDQFEYTYSESTKKMDHESVGKFEQFPVILGWATTVHKCIEENQLIKTKRGLIPIKEIQIGDEVLTHLGRYRKVLNKFDQGIKDCYETKTTSGLSLVGTDTHPLLDSDWNWTGTNKLNVNSKIVNTFDQPHINNIEFDPIAYFMGYCVGDGSYTGYKQNDKNKIEITISKDELENLDFLVSLLNSLGIRSNVDYELKSKYGKTGVRHAVRLRFSNEDFRKKLYDLGLLFVKKQDKDIPASIVKTSNYDLKASFLAGLWDSDGSCDKHQVRVNNIAYDMLKKSQLLLAELGIGSTLRPIKRGKLTKNKAHILRVCNEDLNKFKQLIPLQCTHKKQNIEKLCLIYGFHNQSQYWHKSINEEIADYATKHKIRKKLLKRKTLQFITNKSIKENNVQHKIFDLYKENICRDDIIESISYVGKKQTYDIEVEEDNSFVAQGFSCHNCQGKTFDKCIIDMGNGAFTHGQTYVALSRCRTLEGMYLKKKIRPEDLIINKRVMSFMRQLKTM